MKLVIIVEVIKAIPAMLQLFKEIANSWNRKKHELKLKEEIYELRDALKEQDASRVNDLFNKLHDKTETNKIQLHTDDATK